MKVRFLLVVLLVAVVVQTFSGPVYAERKDSFIGRFVDSVKGGAEVVRRDVENYNIFFVKIAITNTTDQIWQVQIWRIGSEDAPEFEKRIGPRESRTWSFETVSYLGHRDYQLVYKRGDSRVDGANFDPSKQDRIAGRI